VEVIREIIIAMVGGMILIGIDEGIDDLVKRYSRLIIMKIA
jgi:hypothetical protein